MEQTLREYRDEFAVPYLDDIIIYSGELTDHTDNIDQVLGKLIEKGLKICIEKCKFFSKEVKFLGRIVSEEGYRMDDDSIKAVTELKDHVPTTLGEVRQLLGLVGYHRKQVQDFASIAKPLTELLKTEGSSKSSTKIEEWKEEHRVALNKLIDAITSQPLLAYPDYDEEFFVHTDASGRGLGCILYQMQKGERRVIAYGSRSLLPAEKNYHSTKLEFLALKWAVCEKFRDYLSYADHFTIFTDNNPLLYVMQSTKLNANGQRWVSELSEHNFTVKYRPGVINRDADCLSRIPLNIEKYEGLCREEFDPDAFRALVAGVSVQGKDEEAWLVNTCMVDVVVPEFLDEGKITLETIKTAQDEDKVITKVKKLLKVPPRDWGKVEPAVRELLHHKKKLVVDESGILRRGSGSSSRVVWPESLRPLIYKWFHADMGHLGASRVHQLCRSRVFWPKMLGDIERYIGEECQCLSQQKPRRHQEAVLQSIHSSAPLELITIDYLHLEKSVGGYEYILLVVDHFTRYVQGYATRNKSGKTAAKHIYGDYVLRFGLPAHILHDQGGEFNNHLFTELERLSGVKKLRTTPYHPQTNGAVERMNKTVLWMLRTLPEKNKSRWSESLNKLIYAYNCTTHDTTGFPPYYLMFGRYPKMPIDFILNDPSCETISHEDYAKQWEAQMKEAYRIVKEKSAARKAKDVDRRQKDANKVLGDLSVGDRVLVKNVRERGGPGKIRSYWEQKVYVDGAEIGILSSVWNI